MAATGKKVRAQPMGLKSFGQSIALREHRRGRGISLDIDPRIDLTQPIYEQVQQLEAQDKAREHDAAA